MSKADDLAPSLLSLLRSIAVWATCVCLASCGGGELSDLDDDWEQSASGWPDELAGNWAQRIVGQEVDKEEWWQLSPPSGMVHTLVDRSDGREHSVTKYPGSMTAETGRMLKLNWGEDALGEIRQFTAAVLNDQARVQAADWPDGYRTGLSTLNRMAYRQSVSALTWVREDWRTTLGLGSEVGFNAERLSVRLTFDHSPVLDQLPDQLSMTVQLIVRVDRGTNTREVSGSFEFTFSALVADHANGWVRIAADGFTDDPPGPAWNDFLADLGDRESLPEEIADVMKHLFVPVLYMDPADPSVLFHDLQSAWYTEMLDSPPTTLVSLNSR